LLYWRREFDRVKEGLIEVVVEEEEEEEWRI
jgi:hypothetical protein